MEFVGRRLAKYLAAPSRNFEPAVSGGLEVSWSGFVRPGDVLLVEGHSRVSAAIKYLTQSSWSHACLVAGDLSRHGPLIEADLERGVIVSDYEKYADFNVRICRPFGLSVKDTRRVIDFGLARLGYKYDLRNLFDLARYFLHRVPAPSRHRRWLLTLGSGDPTRAVCSTLIAEGFQAVRYPILPHAWWTSPDPRHRQLIYQIRNFHAYTPRDFDLSPYFEIVKPTLRQGIDYRKLAWNETAVI